MVSKSTSAAQVRTVRAVERAFDVLMHIAHQDTPVGLSQISRDLKLDKATVLRLIVTLKARGLIRQIQENRSYELVLPGPLLIGGTDHGLRHMCHPYLEALARKTKETVCLVCPWGLERTHVDVIPARHELRLVPEIGSIWPMYVGASGRVMMAFMPRQKVEDIIRETKLARRNAARVPAKEEIFADLIRIRRRGFLVSAGETVEGGAAVAAPIIDRNERVVGAIAIRGPSTRLTHALLRQYAPLVQDATRKLSRELGFALDPLSMEWQTKLGWNDRPFPVSPRSQTNSRLTDKQPAIAPRQRALAGI